MRRLLLIVLAVIVACAVLLSWNWRSEPEPARSSVARSDSALGSAVERPKGAGRIDRAPADRPPGSEPERREAARSAQGSDLISDDPRAVEREKMRKLTRAMLSDSIDAFLPGHKLSSDELDRLADSVSSLREAQVELRALPEDPELANVRRALTERIARSGEEFAEIMDMSLGEFTEAVQPDVGVDAHDPLEIVPEGEFIEQRKPRAQPHAIEVEE